jgi:hypothetical protein
MFNIKSLDYNMKTRYSTGNLNSWRNGMKNDKGKIKTVNIPLWVLIESSKELSKDSDTNNKVMNEIERNILSYSCWGKSNPVINPHLPLSLTPELISIIFHFMGDGHISTGSASSSYRQRNKIGLDNFLLKLKNVFGKFTYSRSEYKDGRLNVPKVITNFYIHYFTLPNTDTFQAYVPDNIKSLDKEFLLAGLLAFIVDEGHVWEVITVYSKNKRLLRDIREIAVKCGYLCHPIREKRASNKLDCYRFSISSKSYSKLYIDMIQLCSRFSTCSLAQKNEKLIKRIH